MNVTLGVLAVLVVALIALAVHSSRASGPDVAVPSLAAPTLAPVASPTPPPTPPAQRDMALYVTATGKPDGPVGKADTGQDAVTLDNQPLRFSGGVIAHSDPAVGTATAGAVEYAMKRPVTRIGATVIWQPGSTGAVVLVVPVAPWAGTHRPDAAVHLIVFGDGRWSLSELTSNDAVQRDYANSQTTTAFRDARDGKPHVVEVALTQDRADVTLPDGRHVVAHDPMLQQMQGSTAIFELYETNKPTTSVPATLGALWAD